MSMTEGEKEEQLA